MVERAFNKKLSRFQRFISFDRNWDESLLAHTYEKVQDSNDSIALQDLARRAYYAVAGNCYGRVDIRKRDVSGKFYVLEVNASCGLGKGASSEFILQLAGQTTQDFFKILLSTNPIFVEQSNARGEEQDKLSLPIPSIPLKIKVNVSKLISHPSLAKVPNPVIHVIVSAVLIDVDSSFKPDPEGKLSSNYGKDAEYVSELENLFRQIGIDPIVHLFHVDPIPSILESLDKKQDVIFNACLGKDGYQVAKLFEEFGMEKTIGLNAQFFNQSSSRAITRHLLQSHGISIPNGFLVDISYDKAIPMEQLVSKVKSNILKEIKSHHLLFPVYMKPGKAIRHQEGHNSGRALHDEGQLIRFLQDLLPHEIKCSLEESESWLIEELVLGSEFRVLVAGDGRDPNRDLIVLPPIQFNPLSSSASTIGSGGNSPNMGSSGLLSWIGSTKSLLRRESMNKLDKVNAIEIHKLYKRMRPDQLILQMDVQDLARRAYCAAHGSCYGLVHVVDRDEQGGLYVLGVQGDIRFGDNAKASIVMSLAGLDMSTLFQWLIQRASF